MHQNQATNLANGIHIDAIAVTSTIEFISNKPHSGHN